MRRIVLLLAVFLSITSLAMAQTSSVSGTVKDESGTPIPFATVTEKGTQNAVSADANGAFSINVKENAVLEVSATGFDTQDIKASSRLINVVLKAGKGQTIQEVVVTSLGISREKKSLGYAVQGLNSDQLAKANNPNLGAALEGKLSGVEVRPSSGMPGASQQIYIRGARFFADNNGPLYVIDGMPVNSGSDYAVGGNGVSGSDYASRSIDINPNDIQSIDVLKGQAASALYGMRASNGVIMITTKSGRGLNKGKPVVNFSTNWVVDQVSKLPDLQQVYAQGSGGVFDPHASTTWGPLISDLPNDPDYGGNVPNSFNNNNPTDATKGKYWNPQKNQWVTPQAYNNTKDFFQNGLTANNNISVAQSGEKGNFYIGLGNSNQTGVIPASKMNRYNFKFSGDFNLNEKVKVGANANYVSSDIDKMPSGNSSYLFEVYGAPASYDLKGTPISVEGDPYQQIQYRGGVFDNPYWGVRYNRFNEVTRRVFGNSYISYTPIRDLVIKYQAGIDFYTTDRVELLEYGSGGATGSLTNGALVNRTFNSLLNANYNKNLTDNLHLNVMLGSELNDNYSRDISGSGTGFVIPGYDNIANASTQTTAEAVYKSRTVGFYGQAGLDWKSMLFLNFTGRNDYVSTMPHGNRSFFYPSASLAWVFSELGGLKEQGIYGKLRASYAQVGASGTYQALVYNKGSFGSGFLQYTGISFPFNSLVGFVPNSTLYDPNLKPQNTNSLELGAELSFFRNRLGLEYTYTKQDTKDQIFAVPLAGSTGYAQVIRNAGQMSNDVHEITLRGTPVKSNNFKWDILANFTKVINKVVSLAPGVDNIYLGGFTDPQVRAAIGYTYPSIYGTSFLRNKEGQVIIDDDPNSDTYGMPLPGSDGVIGSVTPKFLLGITNTLTYKTISLSFLLDWKNGGQIYSGSNRLIDLYGTSQKTADRNTASMTIDGVKASTVNDQNSGGEKNDIEIKGADKFQTLYNSVLGNISEANVYDASFLKLREIAASYQLPQQVYNKIGFLKGASISVFARNLLLWSKLPNFDPESSQGNGNMQGGFDYMSLPQTKSFGAGLNLTF